MIQACHPIDYLTGIVRDTCLPDDSVEQRVFNAPVVHIDGKLYAYALHPTMGYKIFEVYHGGMYGHTIVRTLTIEEHRAVADLFSAVAMSSFATDNLPLEVSDVE